MLPRNTQASGETRSAPARAPADTAQHGAAPLATAPAGNAAPGSGQTREAAPGAGLLFLREDEMRLAQDLMFFAYRDFTNAADVILEELGLGRAHHRALHFIGRNPGLPVSDLLAILRITKQSLARVLSVLIEQGLVAQAQGQSDRRQRLLRLTPTGEALERRLYERQRERLGAAYRDAGGPAVEGFRRVMRAIMDEAARGYVDRHAPQLVQGGGAARPARL
ncbi:MAG: MarR family transcriptional regulator [Rhodospirillales bacterium]|nr:MarR family transcriptional regulator [Rhodospirillales bacterium]